MNGAALSASYAFPPNSYGYCGKGSFTHTMRSFLRGDVTPESLETELRMFPSHYSYLSLIARENSRKAFDNDVVRALWIGNALLDNIPCDSLRSFIKRDLFAGKQKQRAEKLARNVPDGLLPHHSMNALYVKFVTNKVARSIDSYDSCCVTAGKIISLSSRSAIVDRFSISWDGGFCIGKRRGHIALERNGICVAGALKRGDIVSVHWGMAIQKLGMKDFNMLKTYTQRNMDAVNEGR
ncbi:hypothetical protein H0O00_03630 [Candidatus Micrarchaeota archaeon]|nr:hypothetical protein [Candidatus Micrarchaeota archaeon]